MDGDIDVETLFNEENLNNAALEQDDIIADAVMLQDDHPFPQTIAPSVSSALAHLAVNGSVKQLTWSRLGILVYIDEDGSNVLTSIQRWDPKSGKWILSEPRALSGTYGEIISMSWSCNHNELAIFSRYGQIQIFNTSGPSINKLIRTRDGLDNHAGDLNEPIGVLWLTLSRREGDKKKTILENVKEDGKWRHEHIEGQPYPPHQLRALTFVNRAGLFTLLSTKDASPMVPSTVQLAETDTSFSHAAISQTPSGRLLVALQESNTNKLSAYYISLDTMENQPPVLTVELIENDVPSGPPFSDSGMAEMTDELTDGYLLTQLYILPECEYSWDHLAKPHLKQKQPATLFAIYSAYSDQKDVLSGQLLGTTIIKRWHFQTTDFPMYSRFATSANNTTGSTITTLEPQPDSVIMHGPVTNLQVVDPGNIIATTSTDGSTMFWDSTTLQNVAPDPENKIMSSVGSMNIDFPHLNNSILQCLSSHGLCLAYLDHQTHLQLSTPKYRDYTLEDFSTQPKKTLDPSNPVDDALMAGYILAFSRSCWTHSATFDDIAASIMETISSESLVHIRRQLFTTLFKLQNLVPGPSGGPSEVEKVPHSLITNKTLCFQLVLFNRSEEMSPSDKTAFLWTWLVVNARWSIQVLGDTYKSIQNASTPQRPQQSFAPSFLDMVCHNIRWMFSVYNYIFQSMFLISDRQTHPDLVAEPDDITGNGSQGLIALLLNHSWSRIFLTIMARLLKACSMKANVAINFNASSPLQSAVNPALTGTTLWRIARTIQACSLQHGLTVTAIEAIFDNKYHPDNWGEEAENIECFGKQIDMMVSGQILEEYQGTVQNILDQCINGLDGLRARGEIDRLRLSEEPPNLSFVLLNMDDIGFERHWPRMCVDANNLVNGTFVERSVSDTRFQNKRLQSLERKKREKQREQHRQSKKRLITSEFKQDGEPVNGEMIENDEDGGIDKGEIDENNELDEDNEPDEDIKLEKSNGSIKPEKSDESGKLNDPDNESATNGEAKPDLDGMMTGNINGESENANGTADTRMIDSSDTAHTNQERVLYDIHKKVPIYSHQSLSINPFAAGVPAANLLRVTTTKELLEANVRRCVRCGSLSDSMLEITRPGHQAWSRNLLTVLNRCVCEGSWMGETVGEGLEL